MADNVTAIEGGVKAKMRLYEAVRSVPKEAKKPIEAGRLKGKTDINPMWRIKTLTEQFGPCGDGWYYEIVRHGISDGANGEMACFVDINLFYKIGEKWSAPISGTGGSMFIAREKGELRCDDDCFKKALTDALSVACKAIGIGADVYFDRDVSKYDTSKTEPSEEPTGYRCERCGKEFKSGEKDGKPYTAKDVYDALVKKNGKAICNACIKKAKEAAK